MKILLDTDAFCKLGTWRVLEDALRLLGVSVSECGRLPALCYMLRKGRLRNWYGPDACDALVRTANTIPTLLQPSEEWLDMLTPIDSIDPGEAQIFASAATHGLYVISGDKRALRALKNLDKIQRALTGRIVVLEAILLALCEKFGADEIRRRIEPLNDFDKTIKICFSSPVTDPINGLLSYFECLTKEVSPLVLWNSRQAT